MNNIATLLTFFVLVSTSSLHAQSYLGVHFNYMKPLSEYGDNLSANPKGLGFNYMFSLKSLKKLYVGAHAGVSMYATDSYDQAISISGELKDVEIEEEDCFVAYGVLARLYLVEGKLFNPYLEGRFGGLSFFSTQMTEEDYDEYFDNSTTFHGTALQTGIGGGFSCHIVDNLWIDFNVIYNNGSRTNYRDIGSKEVNYRLNPEASQFESYTKNVNFSLGVQFGF